MLVKGGGWVEGVVDQLKAPLQMLVVVVGGVGRGRGRSIESTTTNVGGRRGWVEGEGEVDQFEAPVQMLMVGGEVGRGRGRSS